MKKYEVFLPYIVEVRVEVQAEEEEEAIENAIKESHVGGYCGNGGNDKLIGVHGENISIETPDTVYESDDVKIEVREL